MVTSARAVKIVDILIIIDTIPIYSKMHIFIIIDIKDRVPLHSLLLNTKALFGGTFPIRLTEGKNGNANVKSRNDSTVIELQFSKSLSVIHTGKPGMLK